MESSSQHKLTRKDIEGVIMEREPFQTVWEGDVNDVEKKFTSYVRISEKNCLGHFAETLDNKEKVLYVPLIAISKRMAQTGLVLVGYFYKQAEFFPIAVGHGRGGALSKTFPQPPLELKIVAQLSPMWRPAVLIKKIMIRIALKRTCHMADMVAYGRGPNFTSDFTPIGKLSEVQYIFIKNKNAYKKHYPAPKPPM